MSRIPFADVLQHWKIELKAERPDIPLSGSPERALFRTVIEDADARRFILEKIDPRIVARKREIAAAVDFLAFRGVAGVHPYRKNRDGEFISKAAGGLWQLSPFIEGVTLKRPDYTNDDWRGRALARFLIDMKEKSEGIPCGSPGRPFSIAEFIVDLMMRMTRHNAAQATAAQSAYRHLTKHFLSAHDSLPVAFCHGDPHPINVIWGKDRIRAVIDWEFLGYKPEIYDAALIIGCIGMEDPESLVGPLVMTFLQELRAAGCYETSGFAVLPDFVLALRFAWLSEWLRKKDDEMAEMETEYIHLLLNGRDRLRRTWQV
ncbi:MAG TPA: aminoglycoside phosphotransferase family protein [Syntrophales bacterium]|nr:aminoglycoside phosphotransferase family protein [Syntrophales bacterium]